MSDGSGPAEETPICDASALAPFAAMQPELPAQLLATFTEDLAATMPKLARGIAEDDRQGVSEIVHRLKGAAGTVGARQLQEAARQLLAACRDPARPPLSAAWAAFQGAWERWQRFVDSSRTRAGG
ncbi:MAG: Hpt domain-containing protein [Planctomycetes bacterium]|nr:Hpt domain-containing protein [Planctomycetota bacterium]